MNEDLSSNSGAGLFALYIRNQRVELLAKGKAPTPEIDPREKAQALDAATNRAKQLHGLSYIHPEKRISKKEQAFMDLVGRKAEEEWTKSDIYKDLQRNSHLHSPEDWVALEAEAKQKYIEGAKKLGLFLMRHGDGCLNAYKTDEEKAEAVVKQFTHDFTKAFHKAFAYGKAIDALRFAGEAYRYDSDVLDDALTQRSIDPKEDIEAYHQTVEDLINAVPSKKKGKNAPVLDDVSNYREALKKPSKPEKEEKPTGGSSGDSDEDGDGDSSDDDESTPDSTPDDDKEHPQETPEPKPTDTKEPKPDDAGNPDPKPGEKPDSTPPPASPKPKDEETKPEAPKDDKPDDKPQPAKPEGGEDDEPVVPPAQPKPEKPSGTPEEGKDTPPETPKEDKPLEGEILPPEKKKDDTPEKEPVIIDGEVIPPGTALVPYKDHPLTPPGFDHYPLKTYVEMTRRERYITTELLDSLGYSEVKSVPSFRAHLARYWKRRRVLARQFNVTDESLANFQPVAEKIARMLFEASFNNFEAAPMMQLENFFDCWRYVKAKKVPIEITGDWSAKFNRSVRRILDDAMDGYSEDHPWYSTARNAHQFTLAVKVLEKNGYDMASYLKGTKTDKKGNPIKSKWVRKVEFDLEICAEIAQESLLGKIRYWLSEAGRDGSGEFSRTLIDMYRFGRGLITSSGILFVDRSTYTSTARQYIALGLITKEKSEKIWQDQLHSRASFTESLRQTLHNLRINIEDWWNS